MVEGPSPTFVGYLVAVVRDITERKQAEEARRATEERYRTLFETSYDAFTIIHSGVFVDCNAKALELFGVTRDQVIGQSPSFVSPPTQPDGRDSGEKALGLLQQTLAFARGLEGQRIEVQPTHLLKDLKNIIKDTFPKNTRLQFTIPNDTWAILGDPTQVHQILLNLSVNARDAMPNGGNLTISVANCVIDEHYAAMHLDAKAGRYVNIGVTDSGTGIPQDILDKIF